MRNFSTYDDLILFDIPTTEHGYRSDEYDADEEAMKREFAKSIGEASLALYNNDFTPHNDYRDLSLYEDLRHYGVIK